MRGVARASPSAVMPDCGLCVRTSWTVLIQATSLVHALRIVLICACTRKHASGAMLNSPPYRPPHAVPTQADNETPITSTLPVLTRCLLRSCNRVRENMSRPMLCSPQSSRPSHAAPPSQVDETPFTGPPPVRTRCLTVLVCACMYVETRVGRCYAHHKPPAIHTSAPFSSG